VVTHEIASVLLPLLSEVLEITKPDHMLPRVIDVVEFMSGKEACPFVAPHALRGVDV